MKKMSITVFFSHNTIYTRCVDWTCEIKCLFTWGVVIQWQCKCSLTKIAELWFDTTQKQGRFVEWLGQLLLVSMKNFAVWFLTCVAATIKVFIPAQRVPPERNYFKIEKEEYHELVKLGIISYLTKSMRRVAFTGYFFKKWSKFWRCSNLPTVKNHNFHLFLIFTAEFL